MLQLDLPLSNRSAEMPVPTMKPSLLHMERRRILAELIAGDLDFKGQDSAYASHTLHAFAAKFPPQLPRVFIAGLTSPGEIVLDPMMGSGTAFLEAYLLDRQAIGCDVDPLAIRQSQVKTRVSKSVFGFTMSKPSLFYLATPHFQGGAVYQGAAMEAHDILHNSLIY